MRIVYCMNAICYAGGMEMVTICKANALAEVAGNEVFIIVTDNQRDFRPTPLSPKVRVVDLQVNYYDDDWKSRWHFLKGMFVKRRTHKKRLAKELRQIQPDIVVSVGYAEKNFLPSIHGEWKTIKEQHFASDYQILIAKTPLQNLIARAIKLYNRYKARQYDKIVLLTQEDKQLNWRDTPRTTVIPNPITFPTDSAVSTLQERRIVTVGRLVSEKNFTSLIRAFAAVARKHPDWMLDIYGEGSEKAALQQQIKQTDMENNICLRGYTNNVREKMLHASGFVLSSLYEGFGLVLVEAMSCGLPVVSYACPCGPRDIISEKEDGFLVPVGDEQALTNRICKLVEYRELRLRMGKAAKEKANKYRLDKIIPMWMDLFHSLLSNK